MSNSLATQSTQSVAVTPTDKLREKMARFIPQMSEITGDKTYGTRALQLLLLCANGNPDIHLCTDTSLAASILKIAQWGLDIGDTAHVVPFNVKTSKQGVKPETWEKRAQPVPDYRGLMQLAKDVGAAREFLPPRIVYNNDDFHHEYGTNEHLRHVPVNESKRGGVKGAYVVIIKSMNVRTFVYMTLGEIEAVRKGSKQWGPDRVTVCPEWYMMKTVIKHFCNKVPKTHRTKKLADALETDEFEEFIEDGEIIAPDARLAPGEIQQIADPNAPRFLPPGAQVEGDIGSEVEFPLATDDEYSALNFAVKGVRLADTAPNALTDLDVWCDAEPVKRAALKARLAHVAAYRAREAQARELDAAA